ncbi:MAG TPA: LiaF domain-containing protein [Clostridium sp.]
MRSKLGNVLWGLAFIVAGVGVAGDISGLWNFNLLFKGWWTLFIIVPCLVSMVQNGVNRGNIIGLVIGALLLIEAQNIVPRNLVGKMIFPIILVFIGLSIIFKDNKGKFNCCKNKVHHTNTSGDGYINAVGIFGGSKMIPANERVTGATATAIFGGIDLDLRNAIIDEDIVIDSTAIFGGVNIFLPPNVNVKVSSLPIFGGVDDKSIHTAAENAPTIYINATCVFGGMDIK